MAWVTFSGNTVMLAPKAAGTYTVVITASDSGGRTAAVTVRVTVTAASSTSNDISTTPTDVPVSPDVRPISPAQPAPVSPDHPAPTPGGDTPGGEVVPVPTAVETPAVDISSDSVVQTILNALRVIASFLTGNVEVAELPKESAGAERSIDNVSEEELAQIPEGEKPAAVLPSMRVQKAAVYVFRVVLSNLRVGAAIRMYMMAQPDDASVAEFIAADSESESEEDVYTFLNDDGEEITTIPANKSVNVAAYMEPGYTYAPLITTTASSSEGGDTPDSTLRQPAA